MRIDLNSDSCFSGQIVLDAQKYFEEHWSNSNLFRLNVTSVSQHNILAQWRLFTTFATENEAAFEQG